MPFLKLQTLLSDGNAAEEGQPGHRGMCTSLKLVPGVDTARQNSAARGSLSTFPQNSDGRVHSRVHEEEIDIFQHGRIFMHYLIAIMFEFIHYANAAIIRKMKELGCRNILKAPSGTCLCVAVAPDTALLRAPAPRRLPREEPGVKREHDEADCNRIPTSITVSSSKREDVRVIKRPLE